jgi:hypothetical protein
MDINQRTIQSSIAQTLHIKSICKIEGKKSRSNNSKTYL